MGHRRDNQYHNYDKRSYEYRTKNYNVKGTRPSHVTVVPKGNEPIERTIKRFLRKVKKCGIADEYRKRRYFEKPSTKKRKQKLRREAVIKKSLEKQGK